jgi:hypothetical protein
MYDHSLIDELLLMYQAKLGEDAGRYRHHVCRVYEHCLLLDPEREHHERYALAAVFHDIGIWSAGTIDYLQPSIAEASTYLTGHDKKELIADVTLMINWHHKVTRYHGESELLVETFRKADWMDVSLGLIHFGVSRKQLRECRRQFPTLGFHRFLLKQIARNLLVHPLHPLPMFRK